MDKYLVITTVSEFSGEAYSSECIVKQDIFICLTEDEAKTYASCDHEVDVGKGIDTEIKTNIIKIADEEVGYIDSIDLGRYGHTE